MSGRLGAGVAVPVLVAAAAAELGRQILRPRTPVVAPLPVEVADYFEQAVIDRGRRYQRPQRALGLARSAVELGALAALTRRVPRALTALDDRPVLGGAVVAVGLSTALTVPGLPLRAAARRRAIEAGLDTQSWGGWASDLAKAGAISGVLSAGAGAAVIAGSRRRPDTWWQSAALGAVGLGAGLGALAPVVLDPLFNDFEALPEGQTRSDVLDLARAAEVNVGEVYSVDASRRTTAANAYVTGLGPTKRVVLYDTMLDRYDRDEVRLVVAHELGHMRHRDVARNVAFAAIVAPAAAWGMQRLCRVLSGSDQRAGLSPSNLPALGLAAALVSAPLGPSSAGLSRAMERRADQFSLRIAGAPHAFVSFEQRVAAQNVADLRPGRLSQILASHPPTAERIGAALAVAAQTTPAPIQS